MEAFANIPTTAHILGGAVIGVDPEHGVVDARQRVFGYENLLVLRRRGDPRQRRREPEPHDHGAGRARDEPRRGPDGGDPGPIHLPAHRRLTAQGGAATIGPWTTD